jgi:hypothetical protein
MEDKNSEQFIRIYPNIIPASLCEEICFVLDQKIDQKQIEKLDESYRRCYQWALNGNTEVEKKIKEILIQIFKKYRGDVPHHGNLEHCKEMEIPSVNKYIKDQNHWFHTHVDCWNASSSLRQVSLIAYLNDVEKGGETEFKNEFHQTYTFSPQKGSVLLFPSNWMYPHQAKPPISHDKYVIVAWFCFEHSFPGFYCTQAF